MKNFDHKFSEKLYSHKTRPPADLWDKLDSSLDDERQEKKKLLYWKVAAAVIFLLLAGSVVWFNVDSTSGADKTIIAEEKVKPVQKFIPEKQNTLALQLPDNVPNATDDHTPLAVDHLPVNVVEPKNHVRSRTSNDMLVANEKNDPNKDQIDVRTAIKPLEPVKPGIPEIERQELATIASLPKTTDPVRIIFKPGNESDKIQEINKPLELLSDLKNSSISFSEIRSAKSELLTKVFHKLDYEFSR